MKPALSYDPFLSAAADDRRFTLYRMTIVALWPDSPLKQAVMQAIRYRMEQTS